MAYRPNLPYSTICQWLVPTVVKVNGANTVKYVDGEKFGCRMKSYGGRESEVNDVYRVIEQYNVETYYNPTIGKNHRIRILQDGSEWEVLEKPENVEMQNKYMLFKIERVI